ncbi:hypothetical protein [Halobaculum sp. MBLA0143]|uniref:hypothetical protein n=1 Tax=Halobaculum sp. MBLA0143 TaxID=3079933 RepID=UPI0035247BC4
MLVEESLQGRQWRLLPDTPDGAGVVRPALLDGYCVVRSDGVRRELDGYRDRYELLSLARSTGSFETWLESDGAVTDERVAGAAETIREEARAHCSG